MRASAGHVFPTRKQVGRHTTPNTPLDFPAFWTNLTAGPKLKTNRRSAGM